MNWNANWHKQLVQTWHIGPCRFTVDLWATFMAWFWAFIVAILYIT